MNHFTHRRSPDSSTIERLEPRIAPAALPGLAAPAAAPSDEVTIVNAKTARYVDVDGDLVTIHVTKGTLATSNFTLTPEGVGHRLSLVDFKSDPQFSGTNLSITAARRPGGDGLANVEHIDATGLDLGRVAVRGDLGEIDAGDATTTTRGLGVLAVNSFGHVQFESGTFDGRSSDIVGAVGLLAVSQAMEAITFNVTGDAHGSVGAVIIHGRMVQVGFSASGAMGGVFAEGVFSSGLAAGGSIHSLYVRGSMLDSVISSGEVIGSIMVTGDISGQAPSQISALGHLSPKTEAQARAIGSITVRGSVNELSIWAGYTPDGQGVNGSAGIGEIHVGYNWIASTVLAGVQLGTDPQLGLPRAELLPLSSPLSGRSPRSPSVEPPCPAMWSLASSPAALIRSKSGHTAFRCIRGAGTISSPSSPVSHPTSR